MKRTPIIDTYQKITGTLLSFNGNNNFENKLIAIIAHLTPLANDANNISTLINQLNNLALAQGALSELIESLRESLRVKLSQTEDVSITDALYSALLLLSDLAPTNDVDPISLEEIPDSSRITVSMGNQFNIFELSRWINTQKSFRNPYTGTFFSARDTARIQQRCLEQGIKLRSELLAVTGSSPEDAYQIDLEEIKALVQSGLYHEEVITLLTHSLQKQPRDHKTRLVRATVFEQMPRPNVFRALEDYIYVHNSTPFNSEAKMAVSRLITQLNINTAPHHKAAFIKLIASGRVHVAEFLALTASIQEELLNNPNAVIRILNAAQIELGQLMSLDSDIRYQMYQCTTNIEPLLQQKIMSIEELPTYLTSITDADPDNVTTTNRP